MAWLILDPAISDDFDTDDIIVSKNEAIEGDDFTNAFGNPQGVPPTVVIDRSGNVVLKR